MSDETGPGDEISAKIVKILGVTAKPDGYTKLSISQRRLLLAFVLAALVPADGKIRDVEMAQLTSVLKTRYAMTEADISEAIAYCYAESNHTILSAAAQQLVNLLSIEDRISLVGHLWDLAHCDQELHPAEETLIYQLADKFQVPRKRVIEQQARSASRST